jgi:hypothetical protein
MADNQQLDGFLAAGTPPEAPEARGAPEPPPEAQKPVEAAPKPLAPIPKPEAPKAKEPEPEPEDDTGLDGGTMVPFGALEKARNARNDWKSKAAAEKAKADLLAQQLEELKRQPAAPQAPAPAAPSVMQFQALPDFATDPNGWAQVIVANQQRALLNERLNHSEALVRERIGAEELAQYIADFKSAAEQEPTLWGKLYSQPSPYAWMTKEVDRLRKRAEIGDDPAEYEKRLRAKWEAEQQAATPQPAPVSPAAGMAPSLAGVRSMAARGSTPFTGPPSLDELFRRPDKRASRH